MACWLSTFDECNTRLTPFWAKPRAICWPAPRLEPVISAHLSLMIKVIFYPFDLVILF